ncbi:MAG: DMT family transporter [Rhodospirillales bacterium]|nr:DMT family transporter [Rhodospirillales bacterium]
MSESASSRDAPAPPDRPQSNVAGMGFMAASALTGTIMSVFIRELRFTMDPFMMSFFRAVFGCVVLAPWVIRHGFAPLRTKRLGLFAVYGAILSGITIMFFTALGYASIATVTALSFSMPLFATVGVIVFFHEPLRAARVVALLIGLVGTLIILRPGIIPIDFGSIMALTGSVVGAIGILTVKSLVRTDSAFTVTVYTSLMAAPFSLMFAIPFWRTPTATEFLLLFGLGLCGSLTHFCQAHAYRLADVTVVTPLDFTRLIWAAILGYIAFGESPDAWTWVGGTVIFAAAFALVYRERTK